MAEYSAGLYAKTDEEYASYLVYYRDYYTKQAEATKVLITTTNSSYVIKYFWYQSCVLVNTEKR